MPHYHLFYIQAKENIMKSLYSSLESSERKLTKLTESLISELISDEEYKISKKTIQVDISKYKEKIEKLNSEKDYSIEITENVFNFITQVKTQFNHGSLQTKKEILRSLGQNWTINDGILSIDAFPWFKPISILSYKLKQEKDPLELIKNSTSKLNTDAKNSKILLWYSKPICYAEFLRLVDEYERW